MLNLKFKVGEHCKVVRDPKTKKVALLIEINEANIYASEKGNTYVNLTAVETKDSQYNETHFIKVPGEYDKDKKETKGLDYICGNIYELGAKPKIEEGTTETNEKGEAELPF